MIDALHAEIAALKSNDVASLERAIPASAVNAPELIRPALIRLVGQIRARVDQWRKRHGAHGTQRIKGLLYMVVVVDMRVMWVVMMGRLRCLRL